MGRSPCCAKEGLNRGAWTAMEDKTLTEYIKLHGEGRWRGLPKRAGLKRCGKSCRLRWLNYLRPDIKRGNISDDEEDLIVRLHKLLGNRWSLIAGRLPGRTDNEIKNYWNTNLGKKIQDHRKECDIKTTMKSLAPTRTPQPQSPHPNVVAIRTKAVRGTRVFVNSPSPPPPDPTPITCNTQIVGPTSGTEADMNMNMNMNMNTNIDTNTNSLVEAPLGDISSMDMNMIGEVDFSEFLNSPYMLDMYNQGGEEFTPPSSNLEEPFVFSEEMMEDWRRSGCGIDNSMVDYLLGD